MISIQTVLKEGHKVASGEAKDSPYPEGSITMQAPFLRQHGIELDGYHHATLNLSIEPHQFKMVAPEFSVHSLHWAKGFPAEDFSFSKCEVEVNNTTYRGLIYYPHPETKIGHFHNTSLIEVITHFIPSLKYGDQILLKYNEAEINIH